MTLLSSTGRKRTIVSQSRKDNIRDIIYVSRATTAVVRLDLVLRARRTYVLFHLQIGGSSVIAIDLQFPSSPVRFSGTTFDLFRMLSSENVQQLPGQKHCLQSFEDA